MKQISIIFISDSGTKESLYTEQGSDLVTCIHNYIGLSWEEIEDLDWAV